MNAPPRVPWSRALLCLFALAFTHVLSTADATARPTREAVAVWQHKGPLSRGWDIWFSILSRPHPTFPLDTATWRPPAPLALLVGDDKNPSVTTNPISGITMAVWQHREPDGEWEIYYSELTILPGSISWSPPEPVFDGTWDDLDPSVAVDTNGDVIVVWVYSPPVGDRDIVFSVRNPLGSWVFGGLVAGLEASLPEVVMSSVETTGGIFEHQAVLVWSDYLSPLDVFKMHTATYDGFNWGTVIEIESPVGVWPPSLDTVSFATYIEGDPDGSGFERGDPDDFDAYGQCALAADGVGRVHVMWGGGPEILGNLYPDGMVGAVLDVETNSWSAMLTDTGNRALGTVGTENPACAVTTPSGDVVGVCAGAYFFDRAIHYTYAAGGPTTFGTTAYNSPTRDHRPSIGALSPREVVAVSWDGALAAAGKDNGIYWCPGVTQPLVPAVNWTSYQDLYHDPSSVDMFPDVATGYGTLLKTLEVRIDPDHGFQSIGTTHTVVATVRLDEAPLEGIDVDFEIRGANLRSGSDTTDADGQATFSYVGTTAGEDSVLAAIHMELLAAGDHVPMRWVTPDHVDDEATPAPARSRLLANTPNPFNPNTVLRFELSQAVRPTLEFFDARGRRVATARLPRLPEGRHEWIWDGRDDHAEPLPSGVYHVRLTAGDEVDTRAVVLIR